MIAEFEETLSSDSAGGISMPFKLLLFVLVDGWNLLVGSLVASFG